jgi:hypothetical protein
MIFNNYFQKVDENSVFFLAAIRQLSDDWLQALSITTFGLCLKEEQLVRGLGLNFSVLFGIHQRNTTFSSMNPSLI